MGDNTVRRRTVALLVAGAAVVVAAIIVGVVVLTSSKAAQYAAAPSCEQIQSAFPDAPPVSAGSPQPGDNGTWVVCQSADDFTMFSVSVLGGAADARKNFDQTSREIQAQPHFVPGFDAAAVRTVAASGGKPARCAGIALAGNAVLNVNRPLRGTDPGQCPQQTAADLAKLLTLVH